MSEFENKSLQELAGLLAGAEPRALMARGDALLGLGEALGEIGTLIAGRIERVEWEGEAAEAFRQWGRNFARDSRTLDEFTRHVGEAIRQAGQALSEAQSSMPKGPATGPVIDPAKGSAAGTGFHGSDFLDDVATARAEEDRQEAIRVMERLSSHYRIAAQQIENAEEPKFKAEALLDPPGKGVTPPMEGDARRVTPEPLAATPPGPGGSGSNGGAVPDPAEISGPHHPGRTPASFDGSVGTSLDSLGSGGLPSAPGGGTATGPAPAAGAGAQSGTHSAGPLPWGQPAGGSRTPTGPPRPVGGNPPPVARTPRVGQVTPGGPLRPPSMRDGVTPGTQAPGAGRPAQTGGASRAGISQKSPGAESPSTGRPAPGSATGGTPTNRRPAASEGIVGGTRRPSSSSSSGSRLPKGAVVGPAPASQRGGPMREPDRRTSRNHSPVIGAPPPPSERTGGRTTSSTNIPRTGAPSLTASKAKGELPKDRGGVIGLPRNQEKKRPSDDK